MKNFMMRGVILTALLSLLCLPASAVEWSNQDSLNLSNIKTYTSDIKTAVTSGTLFTNVSAIKSSVTNISANVASIYTQIQAVANSTSSISAKAADIYAALGYNSSYSTRKVIPLLYNISEYLRTIDEDTSALRTTFLTFQSTVNAALGDIMSNQTSVKSAISSFQTGTLDYLSSLVTTSETLATEETLQTLVTGDSFSEFGSSALEYIGYTYESLSSFYTEFMLGMTDQGDASLTTMYGMLNRLVDVLASDTDKEIRDRQDENIGVVQNEFVNGISSGSSLDKSDFGNLSSVGHTFKDITTLNGQAKLSAFDEGLTSANSRGLRWFGSSTLNALDSVSSTFSLARSRSRSADSDPYNMDGLYDNYDWLFGGDLND